MDTVAKRIKHLRTREGLSQEEFAERLGVKRGSVGNWELGKEISGKNLAKIADQFDVSLDWLSRAMGEAPDAVLPRTDQIIREPQNARPGALFDLSVTVPLLGQGAAGPDGSFPFNGERITDISASPRIAMVKDAYALYVVGDSMLDRYENGEVVFIDPHRRLNKGCYVVAQIRGQEGEPPAGYIKRFMAFDARQLRLEQLNPKKQITFPRYKVVAVHRIIMGGEE